VHLGGVVPKEPQISWLRYEITKALPHQQASTLVSYATRLLRSHAEGHAALITLND
jgi:hypothetical protein